MNINNNRFNGAAAINIILSKGDDILLLLRKNTGYADGYYSLITGNVEPHESISQAAIREAKEEVGIIIEPLELKFTNIMHCITRQYGEFLNFFFLVKKWEGEIINAEPRKCAYVKFFLLNNLPSKMVLYITKGIKNSFNNILYDELVEYSESKYTPIIQQFQI